MVLLLSTLVLSALIVTQISGEECTKRNTCECVFSDGTGYNLKRILDDDKFMEAITNQNLTFYYQPCADIKITPINNPSVEDVCKKEGYSLCKFDAMHNKTVVLGKAEDITFKKSDVNIQVIYVRAAGTSEEVKSSITLVCAPNAKTSVLYAPLDKIDQVNLLVFSSFACPIQLDANPHHGFFYTLFIILLTLLFVYLFIGILVNYFLIGARGYELIPNFDFWCKAWRSAKLGFMYIKNGCRVIPTDDTYDAI